MHTLVKGVTRVGIELFIKIMLVGSQGLLALPLHVLDQPMKPPLDFLFTFGGFVDITDRTCHQPMPRLVYICINSSCRACRIPVVLPVFLWRELRALGG